MKRNEIKTEHKYRICSRKTAFLINDVVMVESAMAKGGWYVSAGNQKGYVRTSDLAAL